jgi:pimeloyl-ACP methyl ester carboxylesterase
MPNFATAPDGTHIAYEVHGHGMPALVFVHGWSCSRTDWDAQLQSLSARHLVVAVDLAGHGDSSADREAWTLPAFGSDIAAVVDDLALGEVILVGHSMGADAVLQASVLLKPRVRGLVWVDQYRQLSRFMDEATVRERLKPFRADFGPTTRAFVRGLFTPNADPLLVRRVSSSMAHARPAVALALLEATWNHGRSVPALLAQVRIPVVSINSGLPPTDTDSMRQHGVDVVVLPEAGHFPMLERPAEFNACLKKVVRRLCHRKPK